MFLDEVIDKEPILFESKKEYEDKLSVMIRKGMFTEDEIRKIASSTDLEALTHYFSIVFLASTDKNIVPPYKDEITERKANKIINFRINENNHKYMKRIIEKVLEKNIDNFSSDFLKNPAVVSRNYNMKKFKKLIKTVQSEQGDFYKREQIKSVVPIPNVVKHDILMSKNKTQVTNPFIVNKDWVDAEDKDYKVTERFYSVDYKGNPVILRLVIGENTKGDERHDDLQAGSYIKLAMFPRGNTKIQSDLIRIDFKPSNGHVNKIQPDGTYMTENSPAIHSEVYHTHFFDELHTMMFPKNKSPNIVDGQNKNIKTFDELVEEFKTKFNFPEFDQNIKLAEDFDDEEKFVDVYSCTQNQNQGME